MVTKVVTHDTVTGTCGLSDLVPYPTVVSGTGGVSVNSVTNSTTGKVTHTVNVVHPADPVIEVRPISGDALGLFVDNVNKGQWIQGDRLSLDSVADPDTVTVRSADGLVKFTFPLGEDSVQTQVSVGTGLNNNLYTSNHFGTFPNAQWQMPQLNFEDNDQIAVIDIWNTPGNKQQVKIRAPKDFVYLTNPTFFIRTDTGTSNPVIENQADLTVAKAFDSFTTMFTYIQKFVIEGNITVDAGGVINCDTDTTRLSADAFKNASFVTIRPKDGIHTNLIFQGGLTKALSNLLTIVDLNMSFDGCVFDYRQTFPQTDAVLKGVVTITNSNVFVRGNTNFIGNYSKDFIGEAGNLNIFNISSSTFTVGRTFGNAVANYPTITFNGQFKVNSFIEAFTGSVINISPAVYRTLQNPQFTKSFISSTRSTTIGFSADFGLNNGVGVSHTGGGGFVSPFMLSLTIGSTTSSARYVDLINTLQLAFPATGAGSTNLIEIDKFSSFGSSYGVDLTANAEFVVV